MTDTDNEQILGMNAGLEYPDGTDANTDTKMWLHHVSILRYSTRWGSR